MKITLAKLNPREKYTGSQFAKLNPCNVKKMTHENKPTQKFLSLRYFRIKKY